ncbi:MAG: helix-turn-helix domain-containing protein [Fibrobacterota bacterium]
MEKGLEQSEAAHQIGVETTTYCLWEWGKTQPGPEHAEGIRKLLNEDVALLKPEYVEIHEKVWTPRQVCQMLKINPHTLEDWLHKSKRFPPRYSISGIRIIFTQEDIQEFKAKLGKRIKAVNGKGR